ncbi:GlcG/HbpS family heme-binding protein [Mycolicibacterium iranicum]|uniref:Cobalamin adenosyltransferase n=1 Tax=Mycolicibacterium iranicum TaxID=912594 RepID=A0A178M3I8_MYCIR|nr:heme-binding protein [Mycolicibacterium iranicum]OAN41874.1 cobalamin adenosyltransferase [Mycolicibacterium iranicum]
MTSALKLKQANEILVAAQAKAAEINVPMNIAVVDDGNNLLAFARMDGAWLGSIDIAQNKAYTARAFDMATQDLAPMCQPGQPLFGIEASNHGRLIIFAGGIPVLDGDDVIGAVGVSGGTPDQDHQVCVAGVSAHG